MATKLDLAETKAEPVRWVVGAGFLQTVLIAALLTKLIKILSVRFFRFLGSPETATPKPNGHPFGSGRLVFQGRGQLRLLFFLILQLAGLHRNLVQMQH